MKKVFLYLLVLVCIGVACSPKMQSVDNQHKLKREWMLKQIQGVADSLVMASAASIDLRELPKASGKAGCNRAMFQVQTTGESGIQFSQPATTRMFCNAFMEVENAYVKILPQISRYEIKAHQFIFQDDKGLVLATGVASDWD